MKDCKSNLKLIWTLSKNDFKAKFAGSFLGVLWAFVQPVVTVLVYWIVFEKALNVGTQGTKEGISAPFVLWLSCGIVPWFYFSEVVGSGTICLIEYKYLVQKVVFNVRALPVVKAVSGLFVHIFFVIFALILSSIYGFYPSIYTLQVVYYSFALMMFTLGFVYLTASLTVFFRDLKQIVTILLQVWIWATPIMWNFDAIAERMPRVVQVILKANPLYYVCQGYRDAIIYRVAFWQHIDTTIVFWIVTIFLFVIGKGVFKKLQPNFADLL